MSVTTVHKSTQDFPSLDEVVFKSYLEKEEEIKKMGKPKLCCPEFLNIGLDVFPRCTNKQCNVFWRQNVNITDRSFSEFLKEDIINMCQTDIDSFKQKLLFLQNADYIY